MPLTLPATRQLGYGTNNSANNPTPRLVEAMKVRSVGGWVVLPYMGRKG